MLTHSNGGKLIHMTRDGKKTFCNKRVGEMWSVWKEPLYGGEVMTDCPHCGGPGEFEYHREELRQACAERAEQERQQEEKRKQRHAETRIIKHDFATELVELFKLHDMTVDANFTDWANRLEVKAIRGDVKIEFRITI